MAYVSLAVSVGVFLVLFRVLNIVPRVGQALANGRDAHTIIRAKDLTDEEKEAAARKAAISMAGSMVSILTRLSVCLLLPTTAVWLGAQTGAYSTAEAVAAASDWIFIVVSSVVMIALLVMMR